MNIKSILFKQLSIRSIDGITHFQIKLFETKQLQTVNKLLWFTQPFNITNAILLNFLFFDNFSDTRANIYTFLVLLIAITWVVSANVLFPVQKAKSSPVAFGVTCQLIFTILMSGVLTLYCTYAFLHSSGEERLLITALMTGTIAGGAIALNTQPYVAVAWATPLTIGIAIISRNLDSNIIGFTLTLLAFALSSLILFAVFLVHRMGILRIKAQIDAFNKKQEAQKQSETIGLLMRDFESQVNDWLWELDKDNNIIHLPAKITEMIELSDYEVKQLTLTTLFEKVLKSSQQGSYIQMLDENIRSQKAFADLLMPAFIQGDCWLKISAKPLIDNQGQFQGWRGLCSDITSDYQHQKQIEYLANFDSLTGLANRYHFNTSIEKYCLEYQSFAIALLDLDNFKYVNDTFGHQAGDKLLHDVSKRMLQSISKKNILCRLGGDEFAIICSDIKGIENIVEEILDNLVKPIELRDAKIEVTASAGISVFPKDAHNAVLLLKKADIAMYNAKSSAKRSIVFFRSEMERRSHERSEIVQGLRKAIEKNELKLVYQPQINLKSQSITGFEALMRWQSEELGEVSPDNFIPIAEESGLIEELGNLALKMACKQATKWPSKVSIAVNVSGVQLLSKDFKNNVISILESSGLAPERLHLEVTESSIVTQIYEANLVLTELQKLGVNISLDDFGTGFSSLSYLQRLSIDTLKIDRSFVLGLDNKDELDSSIAIIEIILNLAEVLDLSVMVEGVESHFHLEHLTKLGCKDIQGYLFSPPISAEASSNIIDTFVM